MRILYLVISGHQHEGMAWCWTGIWKNNQGHWTAVWWITFACKLQMFFSICLCECFESVHDFRRSWSCGNIQLKMVKNIYNGSGTHKVYIWHGLLKPLALNASLRKRYDLTDVFTFSEFMEGTIFISTKRGGSCVTIVVHTTRQYFFTVSKYNLSCFLGTRRDWNSKYSWYKTI